MLLECGATHSLLSTHRTLLLENSGTPLPLPTSRVHERALPGLRELGEVLHPRGVESVGRLVLELHLHLRRLGLPAGSPCLLSASPQPSIRPRECRAAEAEAWPASRLRRRARS